MPLLVCRRGSHELAASASSVSGPGAGVRLGAAYAGRDSRRLSHKPIGNRTLFGAGYRPYGRTSERSFAREPSQPLGYASGAAIS